MNDENEDFIQLESLSQQQLMELRSRIEGKLAENGATSATAPLQQACRLFTVSEGVRHLNKGQLEALSKAFAAWVEDARDLRTRRSRKRVNLVYQVLRYSGARLGEVLALDEDKDIDFAAGSVRFCETRFASDDSESRQQYREVPLPRELVEQIRHWCDNNRPPNGPHSDKKKRERLFCLDQGFLRRKFQEQQKRSGLPKELLNPRVLRNSRAVELLQGGLPLRAVQTLLGHSRTDFTSSFVTLAEEDLKNIVQTYCDKEFGMETSARNTFTGRVLQVNAGPVLCEIVLKTDSGFEVAAVITNQSREKLGLKEGRSCTALVKATWVTLQKGDKEPPTSIRNAFPGVVTSIQKDGVAAEVQGVLADGTPVCALITADSLRKLGIEEQDPFVFLFTAMSVIIT